MLSRDYVRALALVGGDLKEACMPSTVYVVPLLDRCDNAGVVDWMRGGRRRHTIVGEFILPATEDEPLTAFCVRLNLLISNFEPPKPA